ncbi:MAG: hypothetical protein MZV70_44915 [Desulfobacterales bacterium]|nr:hypothetical protein [Desulfobacterales bacterium]
MIYTGSCRPKKRMTGWSCCRARRTPAPSTGEEVGYLIRADALARQWHTCIPAHNITEAASCRAGIFYLFDAVQRPWRSPGPPPFYPYEETMLKAERAEPSPPGTAKNRQRQGPRGRSPFTWYVLQGLRGRGRAEGQRGGDL